MFEEINSCERRKNEYDTGETLKQEQKKYLPRKSIRLIFQQWQISGIQYQ